MQFLRIVPRLDIKGSNLVKGIHLEGLRVLGKPEDFALQYYHDGADELIYHDCVASLYQRNSLLDIISNTVKNVFIPITVGGGIRSINDMMTVLRSGADKISINTAAIKDPNLINDSARVFGSSTIVVAIESSKQFSGKYYAFTDNGREHTGKEVISWAKEVEERGAGEILLTSIDKEGTGLNYDIELINKVVDQVSIPVIVHGGAGNIENLIEVLNKTKVKALSIASMLHYSLVNKIKINEKNFDEGNLEFLKTNKTFKF